MLPKDVGKGGGNVRIGGGGTNALRRTIGLPHHLLQGSARKAKTEPGIPQVSPGRRSPRLGDQGSVNAPSSGARRREKLGDGRGKRDSQGSVPTTRPPRPAKPNWVLTEGFLRGRGGTAAQDTVGSLRVWNLARRTGNARPS
ncbi:uncharacterized protein LOC144576674 [Callithrix jacchus]